MVWFKIDSLSGQRTIKVGVFFGFFFFFSFGVNLQALSSRVLILLWKRFVPQHKVVFSQALHCA